MLTKSKKAASGSFLAKDGIYYNTYSEQREANIRHNSKVLKSLGLDKDSIKASIATITPRKKKPTTIRKRVVTPSYKNLKKRRQSPRIRKQAPTYDGLDDGSFIDEIRMTRSSKKYVVSPLPDVKKTTTKKKRTTTSATAIATLTQKERQQLRNEINWLDDMEKYLIEEEKLSEQNYRSVMRQVEKLVTGKGITYHHWNNGIYFYRNTKVSLATDFDILYEKACEYEDKYGRDLGNGWLLRHPITKLKNFQIYRYTNKW